MAYVSFIADRPDPLIGGVDPRTGLDIKTPFGVYIAVSGHKALGTIFEHLDGAIRSGGAMGAHNAALKIWKMSQDRVPFDTGDLHNSSEKPKADKSGDVIEFKIMYDTEYAWYVHETHQDYEQKIGRTSKQAIPQSGHTRGAKFLENPVNEVKGKYPDWVAQEIEKKIQDLRALVAKQKITRSAVSPHVKVVQPPPRRRSAFADFSFEEMHESEFGDRSFGRGGGDED